MTNDQSPANEWVAHVIEEALDRGARVDIDGLGSFIPNDRSGYAFHSLALPKVFITYVHEDAAAADEIFDYLAAEGFDPWIDRRKLLPGQNWPRAIEDAIDVCDFVIALFSTRAVSKRGGFQSEVRQALECSQFIPLDDIFLVPVRLDDCAIPARIQRETQYVDLFPDMEAGQRRIVRMLRAQWNRRFKNKQ